MASSTGDILCLRAEDNGVDQRPLSQWRLALLQSIPGSPSETSHGPFGWDLGRSTDLQKAVDALSLKDVLGVQFSLTVADPKVPDCPLVACSVGFSRLTHYTLDEIIGKNCRFLLNGVPADLIDESTRFKSRAFCLSALSGVESKDFEDDLPAGLRQTKPFLKLGGGELLCVQTNAKKSGELFRNMFYLKTVELDDEEFIVGLQAGLEEDFDEESPEGSKVREACATAFSHLDKNMTAVEQVLASNFLYSSAMRRQY